MKEIIISVANGCIIVFLWGKLWYKRITPLFVVSRLGRICQGTNKEGRKEIRNHRYKYNKKSLQNKLFGMGRFFILQLNVLLNELEINKIYKTKTHLKSLFEKAERQNKIEIHHIKVCRKQPLFFEVLTILGVKDTFRVLLSKKHHCALCKQFYKIKFSRIK